MKKLSILLVSLLILTVGFCAVFAKNENSAKDIEIVPTMNTQSTAQNRIWVGTFQIVWNEAMDKLVKGAPIEFTGGTNQVAKNLNRQEFKKSDISDDSYYTNYGRMTPKLKSTIEKGLKAKFDETSDILDLFQWSRYSSNIIFYAMLKKDFKFLEAFDKLRDASFGQCQNSVKYFGIDEDSDSKLYKNVSVLFYNSPKDFGVKLHTKGKDEVILYRTNDDLTFDKYLDDLNKKSKSYNGSKHFGEHDRFKAPDISLYQVTNFPDLEGKHIVGTNFVIDQTIETVDFRMDNEGVKLKSEAAMLMKLTALPGRPPRIRYFYCNDNFVLFLVEKDKTVPYYAMRVHDVEALNKTGKK